MQDLGAATTVPAYAVARLPLTAKVGAIAFAKDGRAIVAMGLTGLVTQPAGAGTGVHVGFDGAAWRIIGTAIAVQA